VSSIMIKIEDIVMDLEGDVKRLKLYMEVNSENSDVVDAILKIFDIANKVKGVDIDIEDDYDYDEGRIRGYKCYIEFW